jgi:uncharacterized ferritin-like protein (DUF455 family)
MPQESLYPQVYRVLMTDDHEQKCRQAADLYRQWQQGALRRIVEGEIHRIESPGRPARPELVRPQDVPRRRLNSIEGRVALIHAITHIEFNAINLALDAVYRFREMPDAFVGDWLQVGVEEAYHFGLLRERLRSLGFDYGDFPAHNGLWEMAVKTDFDPLVRMALVPRVLEARGLDVTPGMIEKLEKAGDSETVACLHIILRDEIGHVAIGSHWFRHLCDQRGQDAEQTFRDLIRDYMRGVLPGPFHIDARLQAGFTETELKELETMTGDIE